MGMLAQRTIKSTDYVPKRFALKFGSPPTIILEYLVPSSGKLFHHKMKLRNLHRASNPDAVVEELMKKHELYLKNSRLRSAQLAKLVSKLIARQKEAETKENKASKEIDYNHTDLNKLDDEQLNQHKKKMDEVYFKNYKDPKAEGFVYDIEQDFESDEQVDGSWDNS
eukprot:TRINITY_DN1830_c0_g1_i14.p1 TRINITY_DN1830_c0_g1~~TRINITY_DN1830_c0_g1_i14.p1  ORF type:complete len:167 (-),score=39.78 TRINITY_DN1830_c0_g1_i14:157-657(-)